MASTAASRTFRASTLATPAHHAQNNSIEVKAPSPAPWTFAERVYGLAHRLLARDGRVIACNRPIGNGPLLEQAPAMAALLRELVTAANVEDLRQRAARILDRIEQHRMREPSEDDEQPTRTLRRRAQ